MSQDYVKYLTYSENDLEWGLVCTVAGYSNINQGVEYPKLNHPQDYLFKWEKGRAILEYQLIYIVRGEGVFESPFYFSRIFKQKCGITAEEYRKKCRGDIRS